MNQFTTNDSNIRDFTNLISPAVLKSEIKISSKAKDAVLIGRQAVQKILNREDHRLMMIVGPCSIHDPKAAIDYANRLKKLSDEVSDSILIVMRVYFEKPRTTVGWKGLINDPDLNDSYNIEKGLEIARKLMIEISELGLPIATESLDPISPQYLHDLVSWTAIGARTTESQTHREMASGLSSAVGFKNGTNGSVSPAINALKSVSHAHSFLGMNENGYISIINTKGNEYSHVVLRGGEGRPNYNSISIAKCERQLIDNNLSPNIMIDCSHENSNKNHEAQPLVLENVTNQIVEGNESIIGAMLESNIGPGRQNISKEMQYGISITDACIDWDTTEKSVLGSRKKLKDALIARKIKLQSRQNQSLLSESKIA